MNKCEVCAVGYWRNDLEREHWFLYNGDLPDAYYEEDGNGDLTIFSFCPFCGNKND